MNRQSNKITAIYCRLAYYCGNTDRATAWNQMERLGQYVAEQGLTNPELFCDWGFSGLDNNRPQFQRMIRAVEAGMVSNLVVRDYSRLGRDYQMCNRFVEVLLPRYGVTFHTVKDTHRVDFVAVGVGDKFSRFIYDQIGNLITGKSGKSPCG